MRQVPGDTGSGESVLRRAVVMKSGGAEDGDGDEEVIEHWTHDP